MLNFTAPIPLSLYIHLPWCVRKCPYCDFNSHEARTTLPEELYVAALIRDLDENLPKVWGRRPVSIFFGGGTPSLFSPQSIDKVLSAIHSRFTCSPTIEVTLEANPGTIDADRFRGFKQAGINRLSIGLQSLQNDKLHSLGRIHDSEQALRAIDQAIAAGFENFNLDLMHGLPEQSLADAIEDLQKALQFVPPHLSWYQLTIEPNTFFHFRPPALPQETVLADIQEAGKNFIAASHLIQYEVSAYAAPGRECIHNKNYWQFGDYLGIGAGAHSKLTHIDQQTVTRHSQVKNPQDYLDRSKKMTLNEKNLTPRDILFEFMLNALRLTQGVSMQLFLERTGLAAIDAAPLLEQAKNKKLLINDDLHICATDLGHLFLNDLIGLFLCA